MISLGDAWKARVRRGKIWRPSGGGWHRHAGGLGQGGDSENGKK